MYLFIHTYIHMYIYIHIYIYTYICIYVCIYVIFLAEILENCDLPWICWMTKRYKFSWVIVKGAEREGEGGRGR